MKTLTSVNKFGGTSMSNACAIDQVARIVREHELSVIVVSAPGKMSGEDKVTDLLISGNYKRVFDRIKGIVLGLDLPNDRYVFLAQELDRRIKKGDKELIVAFGEYAAARVLTWHLKQHDSSWQFVDATSLFVFGEDAAHVVPGAIKHAHDRIVVPGFYGRCGRFGRTKLFPRGGGDITGAMLTASFQAQIYQNWTDVDGVYTTDPKTGVFPEIYHSISYQALARLAGKGANVFHPAAIEPVRRARIPTRVRNTFNPVCLGTLVLPDHL